jgi:hypothetical protein
VSSPVDYALLVIAATCWCYAEYCLIQLRFERELPLVWWEPVPLDGTDVTPQGREYQRQFILAFMAGACAVLLAVALCTTR